MLANLVEDQYSRNLSRNHRIRRRCLQLLQGAVSRVGTVHGNLLHF